MKPIYTAVFCLLAAWGVQAQSYPEFSELSGQSMNHFSSVPFGNEYIYQLNIPPNGIMMYRIGADAAILDSVAVPNSLGNIFHTDNRLFFSGLEWNGSVFSTMRQVFTEYDADLEIVQKTNGVSLQPIYSPIIQEQTETMINTQAGSFQFYNDTLFSFDKYLVVDSPLVFLGTANLFSKTGIDGELYGNFPLSINSLSNCFFVGNRLFVQGSAYVSAFQPRTLLEFDSNGNLLRGADYDTFGSGEYLDGALGGRHKELFYFTYLGYDPTLPGCAEDNATIDVRDSAWTVLHRLKLPDCGYLVSGKMPFGFDAQDNVFYAAPHELFEKIMVYKFTPDFQLIWKTELNFENEQSFVFPISQHPTEDGGILLNCYKIENGARRLVILKISASGNPVSSTQFTQQESEPAAPLFYPNPTYGPLHISPGISEATTVQISSVDGRLLDVVNLSAGPVDLSAYPRGAYVLTLWDQTRRLRVGAEVVVKR